MWKPNRHNLSIMWKEKKKSASNFRFSIVILFFFHQKMFQIKLWDRVYIIQENSHSWCGLTACESGRWETANAWVKPPSVTRLLCYFFLLLLFFFFFWLSCCDRHKYCLFPGLHVSLRRPSPCKDSALHHPFFLPYHLLWSQFNTLHNISVCVPRRRGILALGFK